MIDVTNIHQPVLLDDCVNLVAPALQHEGAVAVDCTLGLAGHSTAFLKAAPQARLIGIDRDSEALALATERMVQEGLSDRFTPVHAAFDQLDQAWNEWMPCSWIWVCRVCRLMKRIVDSRTPMMPRWICAWT